MAPQAFTRNYTDHSNDSGFQFEFHCDKCGSGFRSPFVANKIGMAAGFLKAAGSIFGGGLASAGWGADHVKDALRGKGWDDAYASAIAACKPKFHQCTRCGKWVCPDVCWNEKRSLCEECAPDLQEEAAAAQARAAAEQVWEKARATELATEVDLRQDQLAACPHCNARVNGGKFCPSCGKGLQSKLSCGKCNAELAAGAKFCGDCGTPRA